MADLGNGVLDTAMVETAAYCVEARREVVSTPFIRLFRIEDKSDALAKILDRIRDGKVSPECRFVDPSSFKQIPGSPFAYWIGEDVLRVFASCPPLGTEGRDAQVGASTKHDARFVRLWWEVPSKMSARSKSETLAGKRWVPFVKGGVFSPYHSDLEVVIDWHMDGMALKEYISEYRGSRGWGFNWTAALNGYTHYFRPGLVWSLTQPARVQARVLPAGCIFVEKGPAILVRNDDHATLYWLLSVLNSPTFRLLLHLKTSFGSRRSWSR